MHKDQRYPAPRVKLLAEPVKPENVRTNMLRSMVLMEQTMEIANSVLQAVRAWDKRKITKRIREIVAVALPAYTVSYERDMFMDRHSLTIWTVGDSYSRYGDSRMTLELTRGGGNSVFDYAWFEKRVAEQYITGNAEAIAELTEQLQVIEEEVEHYNSILPGVREALSRLGRMQTFAFSD